MMKKVFILFVAILLFTPTLYAQDSSYFGVGFLRSDGIFVPYIQNKDNQWQYIADNVSALHQIQYYYRTWYLTLENGEKETLEVGTIVKFDPGEAQGWGMISSYQSNSVAGYGSYPVPMIGIATTKKTPLKYFEPIDKYQNSSISKSFKRYVEIIYSKNEEHFLQEAPREKRKGENYIYGYPEELFDSIPKDTLSISISGAAVAMKQADLINFKASKTFPGCGPVFHFSGWLMHQNGEFKTIQNDFEITGCGWKGVGILNPEALIEYKGKYLIIAQKYFYEGRGFELFEVNKNSINELSKKY